MNTLNFRPNLANLNEIWHGEIWHGQRWRSAMATACAMAATAAMTIGCQSAQSAPQEQGSAQSQVEIGSMAERSVTVAQTFDAPSGAPVLAQAPDAASQPAPPQPQDAATQDAQPPAPDPAALADA